MTTDELVQAALKLALGLVLALLSSLIGVLGWFLRGLHTRFEQHLTDCAVEARTVGERLAKVETTVGGMDARLDDLKGDVTKIDGKLDKVLDRLAGRA